ncbi:maleylacetoacetate isomerase-like [Uloborus diversus]|uniref:maleylacetoacetate isomerase-like n=1 Tax=Uloborus diversus TaxID=327109 RepID=UPI002409E75E|nr:maleylacetoacetate isomerase-like [Uloborus diversus]
MALAKPILYSYFRSSCSWRVRIALALKGIDYELKAVNLLTGEHLSPEFREINPQAEVPAFVHSGHVLGHSVAILEYLEEVEPAHPLLPKDPASRAAVRAIVDSIVAGIQPLQNMRVLKYLESNVTSWAKHWVEFGFESLERSLQKTHGLYCFGDEVTLADVCLVPQVFNGSRFDVDMKQFPLISEINNRLLQLKAFKTNHPFAQPDCPDNLKTNFE